MPKARWKSMPYHPYVGIRLKCSNCGHVEPDRKPFPKFCGGCGSEMENHRNEVADGHLEALNSF